MTATEYTYTDEAEAHRARRAFIDLGHEVSLLAGDDRGEVTVYTFDVHAEAALDPREARA